MDYDRHGFEHPVVPLQVNCLPRLVCGGAVNPLRQAPYVGFHRVPVDTGPRGERVYWGPFSEQIH
jgi:hypothetical protein